MTLSRHQHRLLSYTCTISLPAGIIVTNSRSSEWPFRFPERNISNSYDWISTRPIDSERCEDYAGLIAKARPRFRTKVWPAVTINSSCWVTRAHHRSQELLYTTAAAAAASERPFRNPQWKIPNLYHSLDIYLAGVFYRERNKDIAGLISQEKSRFRTNIWPVIAANSRCWAIRAHCNSQGPR